MVTLREIKIKSVEIILYSTYGSLHLCVELLIYFIRAKVIHLYCTSFLTRLFTLTWKQTAFRVKLCFSQEMSLWSGSERIKIRQLWLQTATFFSLTTWRPGPLWLAAHSPHCPAPPAAAPASARSPACRPHQCWEAAPAAHTHTKSQNCARQPLSKKQLQIEVCQETLKYF